VSKKVRLWGWLAFQLLLKCVCCCELLSAVCCTHLYMQESCCAGVVQGISQAGGSKERLACPTWAPVLRLY
jgi:hypothetical protein